MHFNTKTKCNTTNEEDNNLGEHFISNEQQQDVEILKINETPIPEVSFTKFLGVTIDNKLSWIPQINDLHKKLKSATGVLNTCVTISLNNTINHYTMLFSRATSHTALLFFELLARHAVKSYLKSKSTSYEYYLGI